jgi:drug/metabolite transporter (DMT)-like permease
MALHQASGRTSLGIGLSVTTAACWATLPIALKLMLEALDPITLTWFRFLVAAVLTGGWLALRGRLVGYGALGARGWTMLAVAAAMLVGNYVFYLLGVQHTTPGNAQLIIQLLVVLAAVVWAAYALAQKQLLVKLGSMRILAFIYAAAALALWPFANPSTLASLDALQWALLAFCALNTVVAYGAFAEALAHWEASRVSAVLATTPLLCLAAVAAVHALWPASLAPEPIAALGWLGAVLVVAGSACVSLLGRRRA